MEAWISLNKQHPLNKGSNYCRYGREIPKVESKHDLCKYFGVNKERAEFILKKLMSDSRIICKPHKTAGSTNREIIEKIETVIEEKKEDNKNNLSDKTNKELKDMLDEKGIEYSKKDTKKDLIELLKD